MDTNTSEIIFEKHLELLEIIDMQNKNISKLGEAVDKLADVIIELKRRIKLIESK